MSFIYLLVFCFSVVNSDIYNVQIATESHVNSVDRRFLSFSVDPKLLFSSIGKYSKECTCMASALTPAYMRIAGPSTSLLNFTNSTMTFGTDRAPSVFQREAGQVGVRPKQWEKFVKWSKTTGFDMVFALNSDQKTGPGMWDPNTALSILTAADGVEITDIFWQLGYECRNQSIEEYLNDLETLRVIIETFSRPEWKVVGGDVTNCLHADSKSDFKDYVTLSNDMMDAILLNGNSSSQELERMSEKDRMKLLKLLTKSDVPLWLTERSRVDAELERAAEWLASLGFSARNGFAVHYRDLLEEELYEPTLSFYMALLFKNLVGERVLDVDMDVSKATLFAHCTSLHHKPVPGALTLYGANMDDEPARFSLKLSKKEEGGDIMQFILGHDENGNIVVNSHTMYYEGDIRPVVKRVRPYKTLLLNLPPKSFGFWVLANTQVEACREIDTKKLEDSNEVVVLSQEEPHVVKVKRSVINDDNIECIDEEYMDGAENDILDDKNGALLDRVVNINRGLKKMQSIFQNKNNNDALIRLRRQVLNNNGRYKLRENKLMERINELSLSSNLIRKLLDITNINMTSPLRNDLLKKRISKIKHTRRNKSAIEPKEIRSQKGKNYEKKVSKYNTKIKTDSNQNFSPEMGVRNKNINHDITSLQEIDSSEVKSRKRRSIQDKSIPKHSEVFSSENAVDLDSKEMLKFSKHLRKIKKISSLPLGIVVKKDNDDYEDNENDDLNSIVLKTKLEDDGAVIRISEIPKLGILTSTLEDLLSLLSGLNKNLKKVWDVANFLE